MGSALLSTHILWPVTQGCILGESDGIQQENWEVLTKPGARLKATVAVPRWGVQGKQNQLQNPGKSSHRRETRRNNPPGRGSSACPQPIPADRSRTGSEHTHLCPLLSERQRAGRTAQWA